MLIVADDIDSLDKENEQAVEFFAQHVPHTASKVLLTSRREIFGLGGCTTHVAGMTEAEVAEFLQRRATMVGIGGHKINRDLIRQVRDITDGSPLYIEDFLRLAQFYSIEGALDQWSGRRGDAAREYSLRRELEKLSKDAVAILGVLAYSESPASLQEYAIVAGLSDDHAEVAMGELMSWNLLVKPGILEEVPRYTCSRNLAKLMRRTLSGTDQEQRIVNGLKGLRGVVFGSARVRQYVQQAVAFQRRGDQDDAERTLLEGLQELPNSGQIHAMLGWLYSKWQPGPRVIDAEENFGRAEALGSWGRDLYAHWAAMEFRRNEYRKTTAICERAIIGAGKDDVFTWCLAGKAYIQVGQQARQSLSTEQAADAFRRANLALHKAQDLSRESGDLSRALSARYQLARAVGDVNAGTEVLREWRELLPKDPYPLAVRE